MSDRVLVLGGTGFIGSAVAQGFLSHGRTVRVVGRHVPEGRNGAHLAGAEVLLADVADRAALAGALDGVGQVVYAVGQMLPAESTSSPTADVLGALPPLLGLLEELRDREGVGITYLSSGGTVYGAPASLPVDERAICDPLSGYGITKLAAEKYVGMYAHLYGVPAQVLRISNAYGPGQQAGRSQGVIASLLEAHLEGRPAVLFGDSVRDYLYIDDIVNAVIGLRPAELFDGPTNVGSGAGTTLSEVVSAIESATGSTLACKRRSARPFDVPAIVLDTSRLRGLIDWSPRPIAEGIAATWSGLHDGPRVAG